LASQKFGGDWTEQKLQILDHYLTEYCKIFQVSPRAKYFDTIYVDAFAGSGLIEKRKALVDRQELFAEFRDSETIERGGLGPIWACTTRLIGHTRRHGYNASPAFSNAN